MADHLAQPALHEPLAAATSALGLRVELPSAPLASTFATRFFWSWPAAQLRVLAQGEAVRREATSADGATRLLRSLCRPGQLDWLDGGHAPEPPGPWLGSIAFDADAPRPLRHGWP